MLSKGTCGIAVCTVYKTHQWEQHSVFGDDQQTLFSKW